MPNYAMLMIRTGVNTTVSNSLSVHDCIPLAKIDEQKKKTRERRRTRSYGVFCLFSLSRCHVFVCVIEYIYNLIDLSMTSHRIFAAHIIINMIMLWQRVAYCPPCIYCMLFSCNKYSINVLPYQQIDSHIVYACMNIIWSIFVVFVLLHQQKKIHFWISSFETELCRTLIGKQIFAVKMWISIR